MEKTYEIVNTRLSNLVIEKHLTADEAVGWINYALRHSFTAIEDAIAGTKNSIYRVQESK